MGAARRIRNRSCRASNAISRKREKMPNSRSARTAAVLTVGALSVFGLAACGSSSGDDADEVTLQYMHRLPDGEGMTSVNEIVERWNEENPDVQVNATKFDGEASDMKIGRAHV